jgi:hypothetical protein
MTPREMTHNQTESAVKPFSLQELVLHGRPNWSACVFFACIASLHFYIAVHLFRTSGISGIGWEGLISSLLGGCFLLVALMCAIARSEISIRPRQRTIHLRSGVGRLATNRTLPFTAVRAVRVTLWQSMRGPQSRLEILCHGEEIPCPQSTIPRQQALYLALVMNVRLIKISDDRSSKPLMREHPDSTRW